MLRYGFLPSDFHPQFLILGERDDVAALAGTLRRFAADSATITIEHDAAADDERNVTLELRSASSSVGGLVQGASPGNFAWVLDGAIAEAFADMIDEMLVSEDPAGSMILEVAGTANIPVKVSYGEFTDDFLINDF